MNPPIIDVPWPYFRYVELLGIPVSIICFRRMLEHHRREPRTQLAGNLATLYIVVGVLTLAAGCFSLWQIVASGLGPPR